MLGKWLARFPTVLILDEPTRGIDIAAKVQVHRLMQTLTTQGIAVLLVSSDLSELLAVSDRILVVREGRIVGELESRTTTQEDVLKLALPDAELANEEPSP